jgi:ATP-dependent Clp protease ATP-binding subunit ClpC
MQVEWLLRLYPSAWRQRYQEEMQALLELHTITAATALDLLFGALDAWLDPAYRTKEGIMSQKFLDTLINSISHFDKFSTHAKKVVSLALEEAQHLQHTTVGTEHLLLGLVREGESVAARVLEELGVTLEKVRKAVEEAKERGDSVVQLQIETGMAPFASKPENADDWHHPLMRIDTENLLLGLLRAPESTAVQILQGLGVPPLKDIRMLMYLEYITTWQTSNQGYAQRFTGQARKAWSLAQEEARRCQDSYIGAHHLLLGLVGEGSGVAASVLAQMGVGLSEIRKEVERTYGHGERIAPGDIKLQPNLSHVIELASNEARRLGHRSISTGHLLLVLIREEDGLEAGILKSLGVDLDWLRRETRRALGDRASMPGQEAEAVADEMSEEGLYAPYASITSIERDLQSRELDKTLLAVYPFTLEARLVLHSAQIEAKRLAQRVGPEHLLVGLTHLTFRDDGPVSKALKEVGINFAKAQAAVENRVGRGAPSIVLLQSTLCRAYLLLAADEAEHRDGQGVQIKSEHLLLGLLREEKGIVADLLGDLGTSVEIIRTKVLSHLRDPDSAGEEA